MSIFRTLRLLLLLAPLWIAACNKDKDYSPEKFYDELRKQQATKSYTVKPGDTLSAIGARLGYSYRDIARWNNIDPPYQIMAGQELALLEPPRTTTEPSPLNNARSPLSPKPELPPPAPKKPPQSFTFQDYTVKKGDTLYSIGRHFKVDHYLISASNGITSPNQLYAGQKIKIPNIKQKHSEPQKAKNEIVITKNLRHFQQKTSIISNNKENMLKFYCQWPVRGKVLKSFSATGNKGVEIKGFAGQKVRAAASGEVVAVNASLFGHGKFIVIKHDKLYMTAYANNRRTLVKRGQRVKQGQVIAEIGQIGYNTPRLKFEVRKNGKPVNPMRFLP